MLESIDNEEKTGGFCDGRAAQTRNSSSWIGKSVSRFCCCVLPIAAKSLLLANRLLQKNPQKSICHSTTLEV